jgi:hypothetical protein
MDKDISVAQHRLICEARTWLRKGYRNASEVDVLRKTILEPKRGKEGAQKVIDCMREQWMCRREWEGQYPEGF